MFTCSKCRKKRTSNDDGICSMSSNDDGICSMCRLLSYQNSICVRCGAATKKNLLYDQGYCAFCMKELAFEKQACDHWIPEKAVFLTNSLGDITCPKCNTSWGVAHKDYPEIRAIKHQAEEITKSKNKFIFQYEAEKAANAKKISDPTGGLGQSSYKTKHTEAQKKLAEALSIPLASKPASNTSNSDTWSASEVSLTEAFLKNTPFSPTQAKKKESLNQLSSFHQFVSNKPKPKEPVYKSATVSLSQQFIMRVGLLSNCNINIQHFVTNGGLSTAYRLHCQQCNGTLGLDGYNTIASGNAGVLNTKIEEFCIGHRHGGAATVTTSAVIQEPTGRKYRMED